jgi:hypothetical protein
MLYTNLLSILFWAGVGVDEQKKAAANWTVNTHIFDNILKNLKVVRTLIGSELYPLLCSTLLSELRS